MSNKICPSSQSNKLKKIYLWDQRLAHFLVAPLSNSFVTPNHITTFRLLLGLGACACMVLDKAALIHLGAGLYVLSNFVDHMDGELARISGKTSRMGHIYDISCDLVIHIMFFLCIGIGLSGSWLGDIAWIMGIIAGMAVSGIFALFQQIEIKTGKKQAGLPRCGGFELEDIAYLIGPVIWVGGPTPILIIATVCAPVFGFWALIRYRRLIFKFN